MPDLIITTPPDMLKHVACQECGTMFRQNSTNQKCCSKRCRQHGERRRARERQGAPAGAIEPMPDPRVLATKHNASTSEVLAFAKAILALPEKAVLLSGAIPQVELPENIHYTKQSDGTTLLHFEEKVDIEAWMQQLEADARAAKATTEAQAPAPDSEIRLTPEQRKRDLGD